MKDAMQVALTLLVCAPYVFGLSIMIALFSGHLELVGNGHWQCAEYVQRVEQADECVLWRKK